jgi:hypothetical protein
MHPDRLKSLLQSVACGEIALKTPWTALSI